MERTGEPLLQARIEIPSKLRLKEEIEGRILDFGGDIRIGDLRNVGTADFLVYRSIEGAHDGGGMNPAPTVTARRSTAHGLVPLRARRSVRRRTRGTAPLQSLGQVHLYLYTRAVLRSRVCRVSPWSAAVQCQAHGLMWCRWTGRRLRSRLKAVARTKRGIPAL